MQAASDILRARLPDLMVLDWMLPDCDGVSWIAELRRQAATAALPIILLTARSEDADKELGFAQGADDYLTKPFSPRELVLVFMRGCGVRRRAMRGVRPAGCN